MKFLFDFGARVDMLFPTCGDFRSRRRANPMQNRKAAFPLHMTTDPATRFTANG
jgi:hypothetical protein